MRITRLRFGMNRIRFNGIRFAWFPGLRLELYLDVLVAGGVAGVGALNAELRDRWGTQVGGVNLASRSGTRGRRG